MDGNEVVMALGLEVAFGTVVGENKGIDDGIPFGATDGRAVETKMGCNDGNADGLVVELKLGGSVGLTVEIKLGQIDGTKDGNEVVITVGIAVGEYKGTDDGSPFGVPDREAGETNDGGNVDGFAEGL